MQLQPFVHENCGQSSVRMEEPLLLLLLNPMNSAPESDGA